MTKTETSISRGATRAFDALRRRAESAEQRVAGVEARAREAERRATAAEASAIEGLFEVRASLARIEAVLARPAAPSLSPAVVLAPAPAANDDPADILHQYDEIGAFLRITPKQAEHRARAGEIPTFKLGRIVCARKSSIKAWIAEQEAASRKAH